MAGRGEMPMRPVRPGPPMQYRGPPPMARARVEPVDREKVRPPPCPPPNRCAGTAVDCVLPCDSTALCSSSILLG